MSQLSSKIYDIDIQKAIDEHDTTMLECCVAELESCLLDSWLTYGSKENIEIDLCLASQKLSRAKRHLGDVPEKEQMMYTLGKAEGVVDVLRTLFIEGRREQQIIELVNAHGEQATNILKNLYGESRWHKVKHIELAEMLGISYDDLIEPMKWVLLSGAARASMTGRNTYYILTPTGYRYCCKRWAIDTTNKS